MRGVLLLVHIVIVASSGYGDNVWHVRLMDTWGENMLYRGGSPEVPERNYNDTASFNWTALVRAMNHAAPLPSTWRMIMVNLESLEYDEGSRDGGHVVREFEFFAKNPHLGELVFWRIVGSDNPYTKVLKSSSAWLAKHFDMWDSDLLSSRIQLLRTWLRNNDTTPTVIYIHCDCGCDRTGEVAGAYYLRYLNWTWSETVKYNNAIEPDAPCMECPNYFALNWYCQSLGGDRDCSQVFPCNRGKNQCVMPNSFTA